MIYQQKWSSSESCSLLYHRHASRSSPRHSGPFLALVDLFVVGWFFGGQGARVAFSLEHKLQRRASTSTAACRTRRRLLKFLERGTYVSSSVGMRPKRGLHEFCNSGDHVSDNVGGFPDF